MKMLIENYYDIEKIEISNNSNQFYFTSINNSKYTQQLKLGILYLFGIYKGNLKNKSFSIEMNEEKLTPQNTQIRFLPADVYYKRDVEGTTNSLIYNMILNVLEYNPKYSEYIREIYETINERFSINLKLNKDIELCVESQEISLKKIINLLDISLNLNNKELEEIELTEFELKKLYLRILDLMHTEGEEIYYVIESPEAGLNYIEKIELMKIINKYNNLIIFSNDIDILSKVNELQKIQIINDNNYKFSYNKLYEELKIIFKDITKEEAYFEISQIIFNNLSYILKDDDLNKIKDLKEKNIIINYMQYINKNGIMNL